MARPAATTRAASCSGAYRKLFYWPIESAPVLWFSVRADPPLLTARWRANLPSTTCFQIGTGWPASGLSTRSISRPWNSTCGAVRARSLHPTTRWRSSTHVAAFSRRRSPQSLASFLFRVPHTYLAACVMPPGFTLSGNTRSDHTSSRAPRTPVSQGARRST